jgi:hypothetical protein
MKRLLLISITTLSLFLLVSAGWYYSKLNKGKNMGMVMPPHYKEDNTVRKKLSVNADSVRAYIRTKGFNTGICFLIDMGIESGKSRFFVYDLERDTVLMSGLVTHGCCNQNWLSGRKFGNGLGCGCTSLGRYKIGQSYEGRFGRAYKLYGLDASNSNAYSRFVVLHSMQCVPESEVSPYPICQSDGCPTVSPGFLKRLTPLIDKSRRPILLKIYQ